MLNVNKIKDLMNRSGKSREFFYQELGISQAKFYIRMREANLEADSIVKLAELLGVSIAYLFDEEKNYKIGDDISKVEEGIINYKVTIDNYKKESEAQKKEIEYLKKINTMLEKEIGELKKKHDIKEK